MNPKVTDLLALGRLLDEGMDLGVEEREAWLAQLPADDAHLVDALRDMLARQAGLEDDRRFTTLPRLDNEHFEERAGTRVGAYRLLREIGRGGMGRVWLAARADGTFDREVALKLPRVHWMECLGHRFQRECRIAALLEHPHIARLYDAGVDEHGRPFIAMEYVEGMAIDAYCKAHELVVRNRLKLFVQVVLAVAYAHGQLVVHRDLKPANVLVDAAGQIHLLDFGIAAIIDNSREGDVTQEQGRIMTPNYASPEQIAGDPVGVATDVYSLGVMLYQLLTGTLPHAPRRATLGALEDAIVEGDTPPASARAGDRATAQALRGEIDSIIAKAMKRAPALRYATADAFAEDIERYIRGECVLARKDSAAYRLRKAIRRHLVGYAAGSAVLMALIVGAGIAMVQARRAGEEAERARVVKEFVVDLFKMNSPENATDAELRTLPVEFFFEQGGRLIDKKFADQPETRAELFGVLAHIFSDMGASQQAADYAAKQESVLESIPSDKREERADAWMLLARAQSDQEQFAEARESLRRAVSLAETGTQQHLDARVQLARVLACCEPLVAERELHAVEADLQRWKPGPNVARALAMSLRADRLFADGRDMDAIRLQTAAIAQAEAAEVAPSRTAIDIRLSLAWNLFRLDRYLEAQEAMERALSAMRGLGSVGEVRAAYVESSFARQRVEAGTMAYAEARSRLEHALSSLDAHKRLLPRSVRANVQLDLAQTLFLNGDIARAEPLASEALQILIPEARSGTRKAYLMETQAQLSIYAGRHVQAESLLRDAMRLREDAGERPDSESMAADALWLSWNFQMQGRFKEALEVFDSNPRPKSSQSQAAGPREANQPVNDARADVMLDAGDPAGAIALIPAQSIAGDRAGRWVDYRKITRGSALCQTGTWSEGIELLQEAIASDAKRSYAFSPVLARARALAGLCAMEAGQTLLARQFAAQARDALSMQPDVSSYFKAPSERLDRSLAKNSRRSARP
jgi:serine/threonine-protein kinase